MSDKRFCLQCDDGTLLVHGAKDVTITIDALAATVPAISGWHCPACAECEFDDGEGRTSGALSVLRKLADKQRANEIAPDPQETGASSSRCRQVVWRRRQCIFRLRMRQKTAA